MESSLRPTSGRPCLLDLPTELRLKIFKHALEDIHLALRRPWAYCDYNLRNPWAFIQICQTIRREILPIFYQMVTFSCLDGFTEQRLRAWLDAIGPEAVPNLRKLSLCCKNSCTKYGHHPVTDYCHWDARLDLSRPQPEYEVNMDFPPMVRVKQSSESENKKPHWPQDISFCFIDEPTCLETTIQAFNAATLAIQWEDAKPIVTTEVVLELWRALKLDNGDDLYD